MSERISRRAPGRAVLRAAAAAIASLALVGVGLVAGMPASAATADVTFSNGSVAPGAGAILDANGIITNGSNGQVIERWNPGSSATGAGRYVIASFDVAIPDAAAPGDTFQVQVPDNWQVRGRTSLVPLLDADTGATIATVSAPDSRTILFTLSDFVIDNENVSGSYGFQAQHLILPGMAEGLHEGELIGNGTQAILNLGFIAPPPSWPAPLVTSTWSGTPTEPNGRIELRSYPTWDGNGSLTMTFVAGNGYDIDCTGLTNQNPNVANGIGLVTVGATGNTSPQEEWLLDPSQYTLECDAESFTIHMDQSQWNATADAGQVLRVVTPRIANGETQWIEDSGVYGYLNIQQGARNRDLSNFSPVPGSTATGTGNQLPPGFFETRVFQDKNDNNVFDAGVDALLPGIEVRVTGTTTTNTAVDRTLTTDADGFAATELREGDYTATIVAAPAGMTAVTANVGADDSIDSDYEAGEFAFSIVSRATVAADAGYFLPLGSLGDIVWHDLNGNGLQDSGEPGIPGVSVALTGTDVTGAAVARTAETDSSGGYTFADIPASDTAGYSVDFVLPTAGTFADGQFTIAGAGADRAIDSDVDPTNGRVTVVLGAGEDNLGVDAGVVVAAIDLDKTVAPAAAAKIGDVVDYTFTVSNTGSMPLSGITITEDAFTNAAGATLTLNAAPAFTATGSTGTVDALAPGRVAVFTAQYTVTEADALPGGDVKNTATATGLPIGGNPSTVQPVTAQDDAEFTVVAATPAITLEKVAEPSRNLTTGDEVTYTFTAKNTGDVTLTGVTLVEDSFVNARGDELTLTTLPSVDATASTGTVDLLAPGQTVVWTATYTLTAADIVTTGPLHNTATVTARPLAGDGQVSATDDADVYPAGVPGIQVVKLVNGDDANQAPGVTVDAGSSATFTYVVTNVGNTTLRGVTVDDDKGVAVHFPAGFNGTLLPGESITGTGTGVIPEGAYVNVATATGEPRDAAGDAVTDAQRKVIDTVTDTDAAHAFGKGTVITSPPLASTGAGLPAGGIVAGLLLLVAGIVLAIRRIPMIRR